MAATRPGAPRTLITFDQAAFGASMRILKGVDKALYTNLRKTIRAEATKVKNEMASAARGLDSDSGAARQLAATGGVARTAAAQARGERANLGRSGKSRGLRDRTAKALKIEYRERPSARSRWIGVKIRMSASALPSDQRRLPKHMNYGRWRHPVYGNSEGRWVTQTIGPVGWFDGTFSKHRAQAAIAIGKAIDAAFSQVK